MEQVSQIIKLLGWIAKIKTPVYNDKRNIMTVLNEAIMVLSIFAIGMAILMYIFDKLDNK